MPLTLVKPLMTACLIQTDSQASPFTLTHITDDSRQARPGSLFFCFSGIDLALQHVQHALNLGAKKIVVTPDVAQRIGSILPPDTLWISPYPRRSFSILSALLWPRQPTLRLAVTGTNGKSSVVHWTTQLLNALGNPCIGLGTLGISGSSTATPSDIPPMPPLTTPGAAWLHPFLHYQKASAMICEASSHALDQERLSGFQFHGAIWTTFSPEHLEYHRSLHSYFHAKLRLFTERLSPTGVVVLAEDLPTEVFTLCYQQGLNVVTYGTSRSATLRFDPSRRDNQDYILFPQYNLDCMFPFPGTFQRTNFVGVVALLQALGYPLAQILTCIPSLSPVPGRLEKITLSQGAVIYVDYAHTPSGLAAALESLRSLTSGKVGLVMGCGGQRDTHKRRDMGQIASTMADWCIITDDNPRFEDPRRIRQAIKEGCPQAHEISDRRLALRYALTQLNSGDILLVAGKGHEIFQEVQGQKIPFHDRTEILNLVHETHHVPS